jgi:hypothetical protein
MCEALFDPQHLKTNKQQQQQKPEKMIFLKKIKKLNWAWWFTSVIPALRSLKQEN